MNHILIALGFVLCITVSSQIAMAKAPSTLLIRNITVVSPHQEEPEKTTDVMVVGDRIHRIGQAGEAGEAVHVIDGSGLFLTPGLIDSHTHLDGVPGMSFQQMQTYRSVAEVALKQMPRSYLYHGFTTLIDLHSHADKVDRWNRQAVRPTAYFCGGAPLADGYPMSFIPEAIRYQITPYFLLETGDERPGVDANQHTPEAVVARIKADGGVCVKSHYEDGFGARADLPTPSIELIKELKKQAEAHDLKLLLHANSQDSHHFALQTEVDAIVHVMWTWNENTDTEPTSDVTALIKQQLSAGIHLQPTIQVLFGERDLFNPEYLQQAALAKIVPQELLDWYASDAGQAHRQRLSELPFVKQTLMDNDWQSISSAAIARAKNTLRYWVEQEGKLLFGSDTPSDITYANPPGLNGWFEMQHWEKAGVSPDQFLAAATINNARFFGLDSDLGSIEEGKRADLLILNEDPRQAIAAFNSIAWVISNGTAIRREDLAAN